jgi:PEP-CTERM motif-containing protein
LAVAGSGTGNATASASATGGSGGSNRFGQGPDSAGGDASASSSAGTSGSGDALSSANATGGGGGSGTGGDIIQRGGNAEATADASATGGGKAIANAVATQGFPSNFGQFLPAATANATSNAETVNGAMAEAISAVGGLATAANGAVGEAKSTAKTSLAGVSVQSSITAPSSFVGTPAPPTTDAIAQGGSGPTFSEGQAFAISTVLTDKAYATTLIDLFGASNVADALLGPQDEIFGTADQFGNAFQAGVGTTTSTFDFRDPGDLLLGVVDTFGSVDIIVNGVQIFEIGGSVTDAVINLGSNFGPNIDLTINGFGAFVIGGVVPDTVPEASTWAMLVLGFAGLGLVGYRQRERPSRRRPEAPQASHSAQSSFWGTVVAPKVHAELSIRPSWRRPL